MLITRRARTERTDCSGHVSKLSLVLAGLAVVLASTGTAVAVTATTVNIADPTSPTNVARVDAKGRLSTTEPTATITTSGLLYGYQNQDNFVTSPTAASLAITKLQLAESAVNVGAAGNQVRVVLYKTGVDAGGNCAGTGYVQLAYYQLNAGDTLIDDFATPLTVTATAKAKYCLDLYVFQVNSSANLSYVPSYALNAYSAVGTYTGLGTGTAVTAKPAQAPTHGDAQ